MKTKQRKGFTLIELLIVVAIIGILAVALVPTISDAPARARDATRKALVNSAITAVESYNIDEGNYPVATDGGCLNAPGTNVDLAALANLMRDNTASQRIVALQSENATFPSCTNADGTGVYYTGDGVTYTIGIALEGSGEGCPSDMPSGTECFQIER